MSKSSRNLSEDVLSYVEAFVAANGYPPSYEEIRLAVGLCSRSHVAYYLRALEQDGRVTRNPGQPRGLRLSGVSAESIGTTGS